MPSQGDSKYTDMKAIAAATFYWMPTIIHVFFSSIRTLQIR